MSLRMARVWSAAGEIVGADGAGAGDVDDVADADGARETDDGLVGRCAGDVRAGHGVDVNQVRVGSLWRTKTNLGEKADGTKGFGSGEGRVDGAGGGDGCADGSTGTGTCAESDSGCG